MLSCCLLLILFPTWMLLIDECGSEFYLYVSGFQLVLECHSEVLSLCVCPTDPEGIVWLLSLFASCANVFLVISQPVFVINIVYDLLLLWSPFPTIVSWVHGPPSSH